MSTDSSRQNAPRCRSRCWFTRAGWVGYRLPRCVRCGHANPKWARQRPEMVLGFGEDEVTQLERDMDERFSQ